MYFYIADLHVNARNQTQEGINYDNRPFADVEQMNSTILKNWKRKVTNADTVYILGDISNHHKRNDDVVSLVARLTGKKVLVVGNHDDLSDYRYRVLFHDICHYTELTDSVNGVAHKVVLSHYPILMWNGQHQGSILLYGHTHSSVEDAYFQKCIQEMNDNRDLLIRRDDEPEIRAINVGCMQPYMNFEPKTLGEILDAQRKV